MNTARITLDTDARTPNTYDPIWDRLDGKRVRYLRTMPDGMVVLADNDGRELPDYRHPSQVELY